MLRQYLKGLSGVAGGLSLSQFPPTVVCEEQIPTELDSDFDFDSDSANFNSRFESNPKSETTPSKLDYVAVFLNAASRETLVSELSLQDINVSSCPHVTVHFNPTKEDVPKYESILGQSIRFWIRAIAQDEHVRTALVSLEDPSSLQVDVPILHLTLSAQKTDGYHAAYSNVLLERLTAERVLLSSENNNDNKNVDEEDCKLNRRVDVTMQEFSGDLPTFTSRLFPYYNPYPATTGSLTLLKEPILLEGVVCLNSMYDQETQACVSTSGGECGFCVFMRAGPCGQAFTNWETCLDTCKRKNQDFIEHCGPETLVLRDCVDAHPDYYAVLGNDEDETTPKSHETT